jgi:hypothetical protein
LLLILVILPGGIGSAIADVRDAYLRWVARRRGILVPSLVADRRAEEATLAIPAEALEEAEIEARRAGTGVEELLQ